MLFRIFHLMSMMENAGVGKLEPGVRHNLIWSKFNDGYGGRGFIYVVSPWKSDETPRPEWGDRKTPPQEP